MGSNEIPVLEQSENCAGGEEFSLVNIQLPSDSCKEASNARTEQRNSVLMVAYDVTNECSVISATPTTILAPSAMLLAGLLLLFL